MSKLTNHQQVINRFFPMRPIAYQPGLSLVFRSVPVGIVVSQLLYWHGKGQASDGWMYKTIEEFRAETGLSRHQQDKAISKCKELGFLETRLGGIPAKRYFRLDMEALQKLLPVLKEKANIHYLNPPIQIAEKRQTITDNTADTTSENTNRGYKDSSFNSIGNLASKRVEYLKSSVKSNDFGKKGDIDG